MAGRPGSLIDQIARAAESQQDQLLGILFRSIDHVTEATGNKVDGGGRPFIDSFCEMLEKLDLQFDDNGQIAEGTRLVIHPETYARIKADPENWTPEAEARVQAILARKFEEFRARQRNRRVS